MAVVDNLRVPARDCQARRDLRPVPSAASHRSASAPPGIGLETGQVRAPKGALVASRGWVSSIYFRSLMGKSGEMRTATETRRHRDIAAIPS